VRDAYILTIDAYNLTLGVYILTIGACKLTTDSYILVFGVYKLRIDGHIQATDACIPKNTAKHLL